VLDLFAGTGALALEALSRGAQSALLVDSGREAAALCRENAERLGFQKQIEVWSLRAMHAVERLGREGRQFSLVFADPPYALAVGTEVQRQVYQAGLVSPGGLLVLEHDKRELADPAPGFVREDQRSYGDTRVSFFRAR
jgi:16S rRNA (guanine(966)-N(2))-methyltransferase RsmD